MSALKRGERVIWRAGGLGSYTAKVAAPGDVRFIDFDAIDDTDAQRVALLFARQHVGPDALVLSVREVTS